MIRRPHSPTFAASALLLAAAACAGGPGVAADPEIPGSLTRHLVLVSVDGLRPDALHPNRTPNLVRLAHAGSHTLHASTVFPSTTLPAHVSMVTGVPPEVHGVMGNVDLVDLEGYAPFPTLFSEASAAGLSTAAFFGKAKLRYVAPPELLDHVALPAGLGGSEVAAKTIDKVVAYLEAHRPNLLFVHLGDADYAGHQHGWMSGAYSRAVRAVDAEIGRLVAAADRTFGTGGYTLLVTADHGGYSHNHGSDAELDVAIPWIIWGRGVAPGVEIEGPVRTIDTAPTVLRLLGLPSRGMAGIPVEGALAP